MYQRLSPLGMFLGGITAIILGVAAGMSPKQSALFIALGVILIPAALIWAYAMFKNKGSDNGHNKPDSWPF